MKTLEELKKKEKNIATLCLMKTTLWIVMSAQKIKILIHGKISYRVVSKIVGYIVT